MAKDGFSMNTDAVRKRIQRLPKLLGDKLETYSRKDADLFVKKYREGLMRNDLGLEPLKPKTVRRKRAQGYTRPASPLYGLGMDGTRTYTSSVRPYKIKNGWRVNVLDVKHHEADVSVKTLFHIHEYGAVLNTGRAVIRIPARPAFRRAYEQTLAARKQNEPAAAALNAINDAINGTKQKRGTR
jgi:hypothetical protein